MWQNGDFQRAGEMFLAAEDIDAAARGFWLSETWDAIPQAGESRYRQVADVMAELNRSETGTAALTPLAQARALIQSSSAARGGIEDLLQFAEVDPVAR